MGKGLKLAAAAALAVSMSISAVVQSAAAQSGVYKTLTVLTLSGCSTTYTYNDANYTGELDLDSFKYIPGNPGQYNCKYSGYVYPK